MIIILFDSVAPGSVLISMVTGRTEIPFGLSFVCALLLVEKKTSAIMTVKYFFIFLFAIYQWLIRLSMINVSSIMMNIFR